MNIAELSMSLEMGIIYGIVAMGIYLTFRVIDFPDLTCDGSFVLGGATAAVLIRSGCYPFVALAFALIAGGLAGLATGILHTTLKVSKLLSGILVAFMLYSINLKVMGDVPNLALFHQTTIFTGVNALFVLIVIGALVSMLFGYLLTTDFGLGLRSIGQNKTFALNGGIKVKLMTIIGLILSNALIGFAGALFSQHQGFADVSQGLGTVIVGLAGVMIGERVLPFRSPWILLGACVVGSCLYRILVAVALHSEWLGIETQYLNLITGLLVIGVMLIPRRERRRSCYN